MEMMLLQFHQDENDASPVSRRSKSCFSSFKEGVDGSSSIAQEDRNDSTLQRS
jgi:hypothetical protein